MKPYPTTFFVSARAGRAREQVGHETCRAREHIGHKFSRLDKYKNLHFKTPGYLKEQESPLSFFQLLFSYASCGFVLFISYL